MPYTYTFEDIRHRPVAVIGAGTLGRRIAMMFASREGTVRIYARRAEQGAEATQYVTETLPKVVKDRGFGEVGVATWAGSLAEALDGAWLAVAAPRSSRSRFRCGATSIRRRHRIPSSRPTRRRIRRG